MEIEAQLRFLKEELLQDNDDDDVVRHVSPDASVQEDDDVMQVNDESEVNVEQDDDEESDIQLHERQVLNKLES